ncbi:MAG: NAD-binding protein [Proteobacteria bacterium]|nr:NAD-binding protein [Pseudomonadota bacterium]
MFTSKKTLIALTICVGIVSIGAAGYVVIEDYSIREAIYMSIITIFTVGFGEVRPLSETGRLFTIFLILTGFSSLAFAGHAVVESLLENVWSDVSETKKMKKRISQLKNHYIICGFGRVGESAADYFKSKGMEFVILEADPKHCQQIKEKGYDFLEGDATQEELLLEAGIKKASGLVALLKKDPDNLFITLTARELNPTLYLIARSEHASAEKKILQAGADSVISPFASAGRRIAADVLAATTGSKVGLVEDSVIHMASASRWITVDGDSDLVGKSIQSISEETGRKILGLRRKGIDTIMPDPEMVVLVSDKLLVHGGGQAKEPAELRSSEPPTIVFVDDNPVIRSLYTRLFKRAGFLPIAADNGQQGFEIIMKEKPMAAVVDFRLPGLTGIEICKKVRAVEELNDMKFILFTADEEPATREEALKAGVDAVVLKSPEASEVIDAVIQQLRKKN